MSKFDRTSVFISLTVAAALVSGCASSHAEGTAATGEPLAIDFSTFRQGDTPIDEEDFFRVAGDRDSADELHAYRRNGVIMNRIGSLLALVGVASIITFASSHDDATRARAVALTFALPIGGIIAVMGSQRLSETQHMPSWRASEAAARYNAHLEGAR
jgi:hypothetical protein